MADFVLVDPPVSLEERYGSLAGAGNTMPALGLLFIAALLRKKGFNPAIIGATSRECTIENTVDDILAHNPRCACFTATTLSITNASRVAGEIKKRNGNITTVIGGPHITAIPEETFRTFPQFDVGVIGEGEETMVEMAQALVSNRSFADIKGVIVRNGSHMIRTAPRPLIEDLNTLPFPAFDLLENFPNAYHPAAVRVKRLPAASFVSSRGCPSMCIFCDRAVFGHRYRSHSAGYVLDLVEMLKKDFGVREILFEDDTLVLNKKRLVALCEGFINRQLGISWSCLGRTEVLTPELFRLMKRAGCWQVSFGIESGDQHILDIAKKNVSLEKLSSVIRHAHESGLRTKGFFIIGFPEESSESLEKTHRFALTGALDDITVNFMTPFPGSEIYEIAPGYGTFDRRWELMNMLNPVFIPHGFTKDDIEAASKRMYRDFYLRLRIIFSYISRIIINPRALITFLSGLRAFLKLISQKKKYQT